jgi:UDP-N-acetylmuramoyl-L-alanyl-D-glutamate--2,6-diaminopimelate ligase
MVKKLSTLLDGLEILEARGDLQTSISGVSYDSRRTEEGDLFVAVRGTRQDGSLFIQEAIRRGASAVVAESVPENGVPAAIIRVPDSRKALARLAAGFYGHPSRNFQMIGITGTNGKTTTTLLLESIFKHAGHPVGVLGTLGYRWPDKTRAAPMTTPESLDLQRFFHEMHLDGVTHLVMEVSSHALALGRVEGCVFGAGVFTNLSQDHLDFHSSMEEYFEAKTLLFRDYIGPADCGSAAVINADDPFGERLIPLAGKNVWSYSVAGRDASVRVKAVNLSASGICAELSTPVGDLMLCSPLLGRLNLYNLVAAATTALAVGIEKETVSEGLKAVSCVDGRLQRVPIPPRCGYEVVVDYAHTPDAMEKSLGCVKEMTGSRLLVVFGCGGDRDRGKRPLMGKIAARVGDVVILTSDNPRSEVPEKIIEDIEAGVRGEGLPFMESGGPIDSAAGADPGKGYTREVDRKKAIELALSWARPGDMVFIGGKGHETYQIVGKQVLPFDDREVVRECLEARK